MWQPAVILRVPGHVRASSGERVQSIRYPILVRVRPSRDVDAAHICGAERFFEIHPEDAAKYYATGFCPILVCEHKVRTD